MDRTLELDREAVADKFDADILQVAEALSADELQKLGKAKAFFARTIKPIAVDCWITERFPLEVLPAIADAKINGLHRRGHSKLFTGLLNMEFARADLSINTFFGVHDELVTEAIHRYGTDEQRESIVPVLERLDGIGSFALTEPTSGSDISRGMRTTATRDGDSWIINGEKTWIGNGTIATHIVTFARDTNDGTLRAFIVRTPAQGLHITRLESKIAARTVQNAHLGFDSVRVPEANRIPGVSAFKDVNVLLRDSRIWVSWQSVGLQLAAIDMALEFAADRSRFGRPLAGFQLIQSHLATMAGNASASLALMRHVADLQDQELAGVEHAALAKTLCGRLMRETLSLGRALMGGDGLLAEQGMAKLFADGEAVFTYEGTHEVNSLILGRAMTGHAAFA